MLCPLAFSQGLLVQRAGEVLQFQPAASIAVNGKDRVLVLGDKPESATPVNKLGNARHNRSLSFAVSCSLSLSW